MFNLVVLLHAHCSGWGVKRCVPFTQGIGLRYLRMEDKHGSIYHCTPYGNCLGKSVRNSFTRSRGIDENDTAIELML